MKTVKPPKNDKEYREAKYGLALSYVDIVKCKDCQWPVIRGYCCTTCGSTEP